MKPILIFLCVTTLFAATLCKINFSDSYEENMDKIIEECQSNPATKATEDWLETEDLPTADKEGPHILCRLTKIGSLDENGDINVEKMREDLKTGINDTKVIEVIMEKCGTREPNTTATESAVANFRCVLSTYDDLNSQVD
uniref:Odorant-binding protein n=1 Tax=Galeruca daurica TaxID=1651263 RepID=A0A1U9W502_9CUCU|nr:odorant-binding protein [Galeruca daurica]